MSWNVVVRRAVNLSNSDTLMPEHFFIGLVQIEGKLTYNLLKVDQVREVLQSKIFPASSSNSDRFFLCPSLLNRFFWKSVAGEQCNGDPHMGNVVAIFGFKLVFSCPYLVRPLSNGCTQ